MPQILWQNGPHKVVKNNDGTISVWIDCDQIDWTQSNQAVLDATSRTQYVSSDVVSEMLRGEKLAGVKEVVFRKYGCYLSDEKLDEKMSNHGELMISPFFQTKINETFPKLANEHPNSTHWKDTGSKWCYTAFSRWNDERNVYVRRHVSGWDGGWWFGGFRK